MTKPDSWKTLPFHINLKGSPADRRKQGYTPKLTHQRIGLFGHQHRTELGYVVGAVRVGTDGMFVRDRVGIG